MSRDQWDSWRPSNAFQERGAPITQTDVEERIMGLVSQMEEETEVFETLTVDHAKKEAAYKKAWFTDYLSGEGAVKERESLAGYKNAELYMESQVAEAVMKAKRERLHSIRSSLDALRTIAANVRAQS